jgi:multiple sugar transport system substrate-binding protein
MIRNVASRRGARPGMSRRTLVKAGAGAAAAAGLGLFGGKAPLFAQERTLRVMQIYSTDAAADEQIKAIAAEFGKAAGATVTIEFVGTNDALPKTVASVESGGGPDVVLLSWNQAQLFGSAFSDLGDAVQALGGNKFYAFNREAAQVDGVYRGVPFINIGSAMVYNKAMCQAAGVTVFPDTYDELMAAGTRLKKNGTPVGWCLGHTLGDGCFPNYPLLWSFGAAETDEQGRVAIDSPETRRAIDWMREFWFAACDEGGMAWNDASNNQAFLSEQIACTLNAASIYFQARGGKNPELARQIVHTVAPAGAAGRYHLILPSNHHVPAYSKNVKLAKEYLVYLGHKSQYERVIRAGKGFLQGVSPEWETHPMWKENPQMTPFKDLNRYGRSMGYKGPYGRGASQVQAKYIVADMLARGVKDGADSAVAWAEQEMKLAYKNHT